MSWGLSIALENFVMTRSLSTKAFCSNLIFVLTKINFNVFMVPGIPYRTLQKFWLWKNNLKCLIYGTVLVPYVGNFFRNILKFSVNPRFWEKTLTTWKRVIFILGIYFFNINHKTSILWYIFSTYERGQILYTSNDVCNCTLCYL